MKRVFMLVAALALALSALAGAACAEEGAIQYVENDWNFVENAMDISGGIPETATGGLARIRAAGVLKVATEPYYPPQEFIDPSRQGQESYVGSDMEMARLIARHMGVTLEIVPMAFTQVLDAVADGECDLAISGLAYTPGRASRVTLSKGYYFSETGTGCSVLIRSEDADRITGVEDLAERNIVAQSGSIQELLTAENVKLYREFRRLASMQDVYDALEKGTAAAALVDVENAQGYIQKNPNCGLQLLEGIWFALDDHFAGDRVACKKDDLELMYFVNGVIDELLESGQYQAWFDEYAALAKQLED